MPQVQSSTLCEACLQLPQGLATAEPHADLRLLGLHPPARDGSHETQYRCQRCQTHWLLRTNRWGVPEGFRLKPL
ncbi:hypothetical protein [Alcaligenes sp. WGS1538]|uniref:hypothetical protein n=1 Tax=Alcaligenes sp. WGS1538 TaxID=3366811 RepID=UPI00372D5EB0